jgi:hypothetical protein
MIVIVMIMAMFGLRISAAFRIKGGFNQRDFSAKPAHHIFNYMVAADADAIIKNLHRQMAVAEMPRHIGKLARAAAANFSQRLRLAENFDQATIIEHNRIARAQHNGFRQIEQKLETPHTSHGRTTTMTLRGVEQNSISAGIFACRLSQDFSSADHIGSLRT